MMALSITNWDGIASSAQLGAGGYTSSYKNGEYIGPWTVIKQPSALTGNQMIIVQANIAQTNSQTQYFPNYVPQGYSCFLWFQLYSNDPVWNGVSRNYGSLTVGNAYSVSFWYIQRGNSPTGPPRFQVTLGGQTVWSTSPSSTKWVRPQTTGRGPADLI